MESKGLVQVSDEGALEALVDQVLADHPDQLASYKGGKQKLFGFFVGQAMKASKGRANPAMLNAILKSRLSSE